MRMPIATNHRFDVTGIELNALLYGNREKPPLVFLHGFADHAHAWQFVIADLVDDYFCIALDFRGFGDSGWNPQGVYLFAEYQLDVAGVVRSLGLERFPLIGHSMGGNIAVQYAAVFPEKVEKLVLVEGFGPPPRDPDDFPQRTADWVRGLLQGERKHPRTIDSVETAAARLQETNPHLPDDRALILAGHAVRQVEGGYVWKFDPAHRLPSPHPYTPDEFIAFWKRIEAPTLSLHGAEGPYSIEMMHDRYRHIRNLETGVIEDAAHGIHVEQPAALARSIRGFLEARAG